MRALVLGGYGAVGADTVAELRSAGDTAFAAGRDPSRADRVVDLTSRSSYLSALGDIDVVINAAGLENPQLAALATEAGAAFVEVSATTSYIAALGLLKPAAAVLVNVGLAPGLTNLLAADVHATSPGPIDIAVLLGAGRNTGRPRSTGPTGCWANTFPTHSTLGARSGTTRSPKGSSCPATVGAVCSVRTSPISTHSPAT
jgi:saccharopine dehydrogenase-like NADP-dependent oxidoreductase